MKFPLTGLLIAGLSAPLFAQSGVESVSNVSSELVKIRQEIEQLHATIGQEKELYSDSLRSLSNQKTDLEVRTGRSELNVKELQRELSAMAAKNTDAMASDKDSVPVLKVAIADMRAAVENDLPFKRADRLQALADIEHRLDTKVISTNKASNQLWAFVEDELMLGKTNGIYNDTLNIGDELKLVKVLRIGKVAMFYRTDDMQYGIVRKQGQSWNQSEVTATAETEQLDYLFDSFTKNIRNGAFSVPNFLPQQ